MKNNQIPAWKLERFLLGELSAGEMEEIRRRARECPEINGEIERLGQSDREFLKQYPPEAVIPGIAERYEREKRRQTNQEKVRRVTWKRFLIASPVIASALIMLFIVFRETPSTRIKGDEFIDLTKTQIIIYRKTALGIETLENGDQVRAGDLLQLAYVPAGKKFGVIVSIDGNGVVNLHYPENKTASSKLKQKKKVMLGTSYELDNAPKYECFYFITASDELNAQEIMDGIEAMSHRPDYPQRANLELPASYSQFSIVLNKGDDK